MAINVGMVVHDKINLQSAVDLAAYYGAMKQGEILNQIAHINYQMRQNYKLFVWRFRGLGPIGLNVHPLNPRSQLATPPLPNIIQPAVCISHDFWGEYAAMDPGSSLCQNMVQLPNIPPVTGGANFLGGFTGLVDYVDDARDRFTRQCREAGVMNWLIAARWLTAFRVDGAARKRMIIGLANSLGESTDNFTDLRGQSASQGAKTTFENNLTDSNREGQVSFEFFNSMGAGGCNAQGTWLPGVDIIPVIAALDLGGLNIDAGCVKTPIFNRGEEPLGINLGFINDPVLRQHWNSEINNLLHSSVGFEKNPWCMTYVGVRAQTAVRKLFSPLGGTVTLTAHSFAKPFGGRIGPWYGKSWPSGNATSVASPKTDPLLPTRRGNPPPPNANDDLANYSRYVGDPTGLTTRASLAVMAPYSFSIIGTGNNAVFYLASYNHIGSPNLLDLNGDSIARPTPLTNAPQSQMELAALAPDAFDLTYYSIEPRYFENYFQANTFGTNPALPNQQRIYDFGSSKDLNIRAPNANVMKQIEDAQNIYSNMQTPTYIVTDWQHLLTGWHQSATEDFSLNEDKFGKCDTIATDPQYPTTGNCVVGGRVGYGIKLVSREHLGSDNLPLVETVLEAQQFSTLRHLGFSESHIDTPKLKIGLHWKR